jgi:hypothetical protein
MLADAQDLMMSILAYMVRHNQFSRQQQAQTFLQTSGYDLCRFKQDFSNKYGYDCNNKALGFSRVKELVQFLMGDVAELATVGAGGSHVVVYPRPGVDYSKPRFLNTQQLLSHVGRHPDVVGRLQSIQQQLQLYQQHAEVRAAAAAAGQEDPAMAAAPTAAIKSLIPALGGGSSEMNGGGGAAGMLPALSSVRGGIPGVDLPPSEQQLAEQQQQTPREQLARYLRLQLLQLRVTAQRTAVVESWSNSYMLLDDLVDGVLKQDQQQQQQGGEVAAGDAVGADDAGVGDAYNEGRGGGNTPSADGSGSGAVAGADAGKAVAAVKDEDEKLLEGLGDEQTAALAAAEGEEDDKALLQSLSQEDGNTAAAGGASTAAGSNGAAATTDAAAAPGNSSGAAAAAPGMRVRPAGPSTGDQKYAAGVAARAVALLQQWPLLLADLQAGFAAARPAAAAALSQVGHISQLQRAVHLLVIHAELQGRGGGL